MSDLGIRAAAFTGLEGFFHAPVFAGMKCENGNPAAGLEAERKVAQERIQSAEFVVHGDSQRLKNAAYAVLVSSGSANDRGELRRRRHGCLQDRLRQALGLWLVGIFK